MYIIFIAVQNFGKEFQHVPRYPSYQAVLNHHGNHNCAVQCVKSFAQSAIWTIRPKGLSACSTQFTSPNSLSLGTLHCSAQLCWTESSDIFTGLGDLFEVQFCKDTTPTGQDLPGLSEHVQPIWQIYQLHCVECSVRSADTIIENM